MRRQLIVGLVVTLAAIPAAASDRAQARPAPTAQVPGTWPRMDDPIFNLLAPVERLRTTGTPAQVLAELDRLQPQIAAAAVVVQARAMLIRGLTLRIAANPTAAAEAAAEARALGARARHPVIECDALTLLVNLASDRGDFDTAAARLAEAAVIADSAGDDVLRYNVRLDLGRIARARGRGRDALAPLQEAAAIGDRTTFVRMQVQPRIALSSAKLGISDYDGGLTDAHAAYALAARDGAPPDLRGAAALGLAQALSHVGDLEGSLTLYADAIDAYTRANFPAGVALTVRQRMDALFALGDFEAAAEDGARALELFARTGSQGQEPAVLSRMALIHARLGRSDAAADYMKQAGARSAATPPRVRAQIEADLANAALAAREYTEAAARHARFLDQARALKDLDLEWRALRGLGQAALGAGNLTEAQARFEASVAVIDRLRRTLSEPGLRADFVAERLSPYDGLIATLLSRSASAGDAFVTRAFEASEQARGRALADLLTEARSRMTDPDVARIRTREAEFGARLSSLQQAIAAATADAERAKLIAELERSERDYSAFVIQIRRERARYAALAHAQPPPVVELSRGLASDEAIVSFWLGDGGGVAWVVTRGGVRHYRVPGRQELDRDVARFRSAVAGGQTADVLRLGSALYARLFPGHDPGVRRLIVIPDGPLWRLPFGALAVSPAGPWLIERTAFNLVPSASLLTAIAASPASSRQRRPGIVFGIAQIPTSVRTLRALYDERLLPDGPLTHAIAEARAVGQAIALDPATSLFLGEQADETTFKRATVTPSRILHVASHALIDDRVPRRTSLVLASSVSDDGLLQLNEIANLQLDVDLVVLSTCHSQLGRSVRGEGLVSLSRAFILSGARAVTASIWAVDDRETSRMMPWFYASLRTGASPADALRTAQIRMIQAGGASASPANWAGFVVMGYGLRPVF